MNVIAAPGQLRRWVAFCSVVKDSYEPVHTIIEWYDGARQGIADLNGKPHYFRNEWDADADAWSPFYFLAPVDTETFKLALEDEAICRRLGISYHQATLGIRTALPDDADRHEELEHMLRDRLVIGDNPVKAKAHFRYGEPTLVKWAATDSF